MSGFNFGTPSTSGAAGQSLFGSTNKNTNTGGGLFGSNSGTPAPGTTGSTGFSFSGFGKPAATGTENKPAQGLFGAPAPASTTTPTFSFGPKADEKQSNEAPKSLFGNVGTPDKSSAPASSGPSLFGSTTPASTSGGGLFGGLQNPSTTPAGPPPAATSFGASTGGGGGGGLFGAKPASEAAQKPTFSFGKPAESTAPASTSSQPSLFGSQAPAPASGGFSFASTKPADKAADKPSNTAPGQSPFSFGQPASSTATTGTTTSAAPSQPSTSSAPSLFGAPQPTQSAGGLFAKPAAPAPPAVNTASSPFTLGGSSQPSSSTRNSAQNDKPKVSGFNLGGTTPSSTAPTPAASAAAPATTSAAPFNFLKPTTSAAPASSGGFSFPSQPTATTPATQPATSTAATTSGFSFGSSATPAQQTTTTSASNLGGLFAPKTTTPSSQPASAAPTANTTSPFAVSGVGGAQTSTAGPPPPAQSRLRNKTMDEILTRWATDMTRYSKEFKEHAETIARWDQLIVDNSSKIDKLYVKTRTCERQTMSVDMQLAAVENQQTELESWLSKYEGEVDEMLAKDNLNSSEMGGPDQERERTYKLAERLSERLEEMERDLGSMVEDVNAANASLSKNGKADEPITQIVKILNSHLLQLQAIDQGSVALQEKIAAAQKSANGLGYLNGSGNGAGGSTVQDFYRSYMGRR
ncbi:hypothetical protein B0A52_01052 [Exophiala mesophila]|uniref:Nucleoporin NSP1 n=1 Tax=Exophiala mesophila TaxID=212818 RepID=A0A438NGB8_EXOME|nr:hypothetical protein B0A52_01052 [Exophiala mesophila]